ncbi:MAG: hypothetical protein PHE27_01525 [Alphaproteobacteria bacterium]|nr:hypothetical protein [Alphaproteobacteria bacterium]
MRVLAGGVFVQIADRASFKHEDVFKDVPNGGMADLTPDQLNDRIEDLLSIPDIPAVWKSDEAPFRDVVKQTVCKSAGWTIKLCKPAPWDNNTVELGTRIFGDWFRSYPQGNARAVSAVIAPHSPYLGKDPNENAFTRKLDTLASEELLLRHELGHVRLAFLSSEETGNIRISYFSEVFADGFMAYTYLNNLPKKEDAPGGGWLKHVLKPLMKKKPDRNIKGQEIQKAIDRRRLTAFFEQAWPAYWTAAAIEATLQQEKIPEWKENFYTVRGLLIRSLETIQAEEKGVPNTKAYSKNESENVENYEGDLDKNAVRSPDGKIYSLKNQRFSYPPEKVMEALVQVLNTHNISTATRREGEKIVKAYNDLCPENAIPFSPRITCAPIYALMPDPR